MNLTWDYADDDQFTYSYFLVQVNDHPPITTKNHSVLVDLADLNGEVTVRIKAVNELCRQESEVLEDRCKIGDHQSLGIYTYEAIGGYILLGEGCVTELSRAYPLLPPTDHQRPSQRHSTIKSVISIR